MTHLLRRCALRDSWLPDFRADVEKITVPTLLRLPTQRNRTTTMTPIHHKTLVLLDHPDLSTSRINRALATALEDAQDLTVRDLRRLYPDGHIDLAAERAAVEAAGNIVLQYPTHWYAPPAYLKTWLDEVLVRGWAYGTGAPGALAGKTLRVATSTGGAEEAYSPDGFHGWDYNDILIPLQATARRLGMLWLSPFVLHGVRDLTDEQLQDLAQDYRNLLSLRTGFLPSAATNPLGSADTAALLGRPALSPTLK